MAHLLRITDYNGTVNLNAGNQSLLSYVPRSPSLSTVDFTPEALTDGGERLSITRRNVTESAQVLFGGTAVTDIQAAVGSVEQYLKQAEHYQMYGAGSPVYLEFQPNGAGTVYRSEILSGKVELDDLTLSAGQWNRNKVKGVLAHTRRFYWEDATERTLQLYNSAGTSTTGLTVYNCNDGTPPTGRYNYAEIAGSSVAGDYPAPINLRMWNTLAGYRAINHIWVGHNFLDTPASFQHMYEELTTNANVTGGLASAAYGGGTATRIAAAAGSAIFYNFSAAQLAYIKGAGYFRVLARFGSPPPSDGSTKIRWYVGNGDLSGTPAYYNYQGPQLTLSSDIIQDLGVVPIRPRQIGTAAAGTVALSMSFMSGGSSNLDCDFWQLTPVDSFCRYTVAKVDNPRLANGMGIVDNAIDGWLYSTDQATQGSALADIVRIGQGPLLRPGYTQRLYFLSEDVEVDIPAANIARTMSIVASYRPRKLTI